MSDSDGNPSGGESHTLDALKREAKRLLRQAESGDSVLIGRLRALLPRLERLSDAEVSASIRLADIHHAIARKQGRANWAELKEFLASVDPIHVQAARFLLAVREEQTEAAARLVRAHPALRAHSVFTACACGNAEAIAAFIAADPASATRESVPDATAPIVYAAHCGLQDALGVPQREREESVRLLLDAGASPNTVRRLHESDEHAAVSVLYFACVSGNVPVARLLLERGANPDDGESVYHAAERNQRSCLDLLLQYGAELSKPHSHWGNTPLYFLAAYTRGNRHFESSRLGMHWLLERGADPNAVSHPDRNPDGSAGVAETPLHRLATYGAEPDIVRAFLAHGARPDVPREDGRTPYVLAMRAGNWPVAALLADAGAKADMLAPVDRLLVAIARAGDTNAAPAAVSAQRDEAIALVRAHPGLVERLAPEDRRAMTQAVTDGREESVRLMLELGWKLSDEEERGGTPLHHAAWHGRVAMTRLLLELGAPVDARDKQFGGSSIGWAAHGSMNARPGHDYDYLAVTALLLDAGASRAASYNSWNEPPESLASPAVARLLRERGFAA